MKTIKILFVALTMITVTSCSKNMDNPVNVNIPELINLIWGGSGYYYPGGYPNNVEYFIGYITSKPTNPLQIVICNKSGVPICKASCATLWWKDAVRFYDLSQTATYPPYRAVLIKIQHNTMTTAGDDYYIVGY